MHRRNSDSSLYCKARDGEVPKERTIQPENPVLSQTKYLDQERLAFVQRYLEKAEDARSVTTETSDSGMQGTHGAPSELGIDEASGNLNAICFSHWACYFVQYFSRCCVFVSLILTYGARWCSGLVRWTSDLKVGGSTPVPAIALFP